MKSMFSFAQGVTNFYNPSDTMYYLEGDERTNFEARKKNGALVGFITVAVGIAIVIFGVITSASLA